MEKAVFSLVREHRALELGIGSVERFKKELKAFQGSLDHASQAEVAYMMDVHYEVLGKVRGYVKEKHMGNAVLKRLHDDVFVSRLGMPKQKTPSLVTKLFEEFIKGITYFKHQIDPSNPVPIYHRFYSCGVGNDVYRGDNLVCVRNLTAVEKKRRRGLIERCYLERMIYDELYRYETLHFPKSGMNVEHTQNEGHLFRMDLTRQDYESCFKGHSVEVTIEYEGRFPLSLVVVRKKNGVVLYTEEYVQELRTTDSLIVPYTGVVTCKRILANGRVYMKTQDFTMEGDWRAVRA